jgi:HEAT repeat protein
MGLEETIAPFLEHSDWNVRRNAAEAIAETAPEDPKLQIAMAKGLADSNSTAAMLTSKSIAKLIPSRELWNKLETMMNQGNPLAKKALATFEAQGKRPLPPSLSAPCDGIEALAL